MKIRNVPTGLRLAEQHAVLWVYGFEVTACQSDTTEMVNGAVFPISRCGQRNARRAPNPSVVSSSLCFRVSIDKYRDNRFRPTGIYTLKGQLESDTLLSITAFEANADPGKLLPSSRQRPGDACEHCQHRVASGLRKLDIMAASQEPC